MKPVILGRMASGGLRSLRGAGVALGLIALLAGASPGNDPLLDRQYHLERVRAVDAWELGRGRNQVIAVLDTGVDAEHPDLVGRLVPGVDLVDRGTPPDDENGHGTFVAGVAVATLNNKEGGSGVAPRAKVMPVRVLDAKGRGTSDVVADGIRWATRQGATVINLSLADVPGQDRPATLITTDVELAIRQAALAGVVVVCAAGNEGERATPYSSDLPAIIVGASNRRDGVWEHSNYDRRTLFAPGVRIISTYVDTPYAAADGTSFSAPIVAAGAALLRQDGLAEEQVRRRLRETARPIGAGVGRLDIAAARGLAPRVRSTPSPRPDSGDDEATKPKRKPRPMTKPSPVAPRKQRKQPAEQPRPVRQPPPVVTEAPDDQVVAAEPPDVEPPRTRPPVEQPVVADDQEVVAAPESPGPERPIWPAALAGSLLFVTAVGLGGYVAARRSG